MLSVVCLSDASVLWENGVNNALSLAFFVALLISLLFVLTTKMFN